MVSIRVSGVIKKSIEDEAKDLFGEKSERLMTATKELAKLDKKIKHLCDEIEEIPQELYDKRNALVKEINKMIEDTAEAAEKKFDEKDVPEDKKAAIGLMNSLKYCVEKNCNKCPNEGMDECRAILLRDAAELINKLLG